MSSHASSVARGPLDLRIIRSLSSIGAEPSKREEVRKLLASSDDHREMIRLVYGARYREHRTGPIWAHLRRRFPTRWQLVHWVYGDQPEKLSAAYKDRSWLSTASQSDTLVVLVERVLRAAKARYPWMWRRTLYGYAYGQARGAGKYTRKVIHPHKGKRRVLYVPHKPLARVQKSLLRLVLNPAQESLPAYVMGGRSTRDGQSNQYGIFRNAAAHVGQGFIASFDIKDFFPSVRLGDVIQALRSISISAMSDNEGSPLPWTLDSATFVARLVTRRGRLPQGAPTSPAIANLVFGRHDVGICESLGPGFLYTRYFDDLTVSMSLRNARAKGLTTPAEFRAFVENVITHVLSRSSFRLNPKKTRCGHCADGVVVTGLRVGSDRVNVSRGLRRSTRALLHRIDSIDHGFVATALRHYDSSRFFDTRFDPRRDSHRDGIRRLSAERMAVMAVRNLCGELKIEIPGQVTFEGGRRISRDPELHEGKQAYRDVAYLLSRVWQSHLNTETDEGHIVFRDAAGQIIARLRCDRNDGFFLQEKKAAFASMELWHQLNGLWAGMNPRSIEAVFRNIHMFRDRLRKSLDSISMPRTHRPPEPVTVPDNGEVITLESSPAGEMKRHVGPLWNLLIAFRDAENAPQPIPPAVAALVSNFKAPVTGIVELATWLQTCRAIVNATCGVLPAGHPQGSSTWKTLCILDDRLSGRRGAFYDEERAAVKASWFRVQPRSPRYEGAIQSLPNEVAAWMQASMVYGMLKSLEESMGTLREQGRESWRKTVCRNADVTSLDKKAEICKRRLCEAVGAARWMTTDQPVLNEGAVEKLAKNLEEYFREPSESAPQVVLEKIWAFGDSIFGPIVEQLCGDGAAISETARVRLGKKIRKGDTLRTPDNASNEGNADAASPGVSREEKELPIVLLLREELLVETGRHADVFDVIQFMRNWHSHDDDQGKHDEWVRLIKYVAKALGRHCDLDNATVSARGNRNFATAADLPLTPTEALEAMLVICGRVAEAMETLVPKAAT